MIFHSYVKLPEGNSRGEMWDFLIHAQGVLKMGEKPLVSLSSQINHTNRDYRYILTTRWELVGWDLRQLMVIWWRQPIHILKIKGHFRYQINWPSTYTVVPTHQKKIDFVQYLYFLVPKVPLTINGTYTQFPTPGLQGDRNWFRGVESGGCHLPSGNFT